MNRLILFNKPYRVMCQFTDQAGRATLADYLPVADVYPKRLPDLFSAKPLILSGRYTSAARGVV